MKIPDKFMLMGREIEVRWRDDLADREDASGNASWRRGRIELQGSCVGHEIARGYIEQSYLHELTHLILLAMGQEEVSEDEDFVDMFSNLLHQAVVSGG